MRLLLISVLTFLGLAASFDAAAQAAKRLTSGKIKGFAFYGPADPDISPQLFTSMQAVGADWIAVVPEITLNRYTLGFQPDSLNDHWGETLKASKRSITLAKERGLRVMLKPHLVLVKPDAFDEQQKEQWVARNSSYTSRRLKDKTGGADWRGNFYPPHAVDRHQWETNYRQYLLQLASIADSLSVDLFCVGTELKKYTFKNPDYWRRLIAAVRTQYSGPITYSANWDEYERIAFWDELDCIGLNAYFPVSRRKLPGIAGTKRKWRQIRKRLRRFAAVQQRKVLFTEFGYRNIESAGRRPWEHDEARDTRSDRAQSNLYEAFFRSFWARDWVLGGFSWKWFAEVPPAGNMSFSIQGKPAYEVVRKWYGTADGK